MMEKYRNDKNTDIVNLSPLALRLTYHFDLGFGMPNPYAIADAMNGVPTGYNPDSMNAAP